MFTPFFPSLRKPLSVAVIETHRNDLRKVLDESDDSLGDVETTKSTTSTLPPTTSTTTVTTTRSTTTQRSTKRYYAPSKSPDDVPKTPKTYFSNSFYNNNNQNNINGQSDRSKSPFKGGVTQKTLGDTETPKPASAKATINPFYYGFNRLPQYQNNTTTTQKTIRPTFTTTNRTPYSFQYFTTTKKLDLLTASTTQVTNYEVDNNYYENQSPPSVLVETEKPKSSTYNPVFDIYFKQIGRQRTTTNKSS